MSMNQPNHIPILQKPNIRTLKIKIRFITIRINSPIVIGVFVMVTRHLLLLTPLRVKLNVRVKQATPYPALLIVTLDPNAISRGELGRSEPLRLAWKREDICASPGPEFSRMRKWIQKEAM